jgi:PGF-CTERM protein
MRRTLAVLLGVALVAATLPVVVVGAPTRHPTASTPPPPPRRRPRWSTTASDSTPGFGVALALVAVVATALVVVRRD